MTNLPKYIIWPETVPGKGTVTSKMYSKEYRSFRFKGGTPGAWPGVEELAMPGKETARDFIRNGVPKDVLTALDGPSRFRQRAVAVQTTP
jgi:hypothetical protein